LKARLAKRQAIVLKEGRAQEENESEKRE